MTFNCVVSLAVGLAVFGGLAYGLATLLQEADAAVTVSTESSALPSFPNSTEELKQTVANMMNDKAFAEGLSEIAPAAGDDKDAR
jgi:hypothetical protein